MRPRSLIAAVLLSGLAGLVLVGAAVLRDPEYDEGYTAFVTGTAARPDWPSTPFRVGDGRAAFRPAPAPWAIAGNLRRTDVHPPLYFWTVWAWRRLVGASLIGTRLLSVSFSLGALALVAAIAAEAGLPVAPAVLLTLGCYGFVETGIVARGFAMAQCLTLAGLLLTLRASRKASRPIALATGVAFGAATFTNYLTVFPALTALAWALRRRPGLACVMLVGMLPFLLGDASFFLAQRDSRIGQFAPFAWVPMAAGLGRAFAGAVLGGLPLYAPAGGRHALSAALALLLLVLLALPVMRWRRIGRGGAGSLLALAVLSTPLGLVLMALASDSMPVEIRYLAFALPPMALLLAGSLSGLRPILIVTISIQALSLAGLMLRPETMQPEGAAARAAFRAVGENGLVLLARGNDGVGLVSAFLSAAPDGLHILLLQPGSPLAAACDAVAGWPRLTAATIVVDRSSEETLPLLHAALRNCDQIR